MRRRPLDQCKSRRILMHRRTRCVENSSNSWGLFLQFLLTWLVVLLLDHVLEFRLEFLWTFWLTFTTVSDFYDCQGLTRTCIYLAVTTIVDYVVLALAPVQWLFFAGSAYVWVQFVWSADGGLSLPTLVLWLLVAYVEAVMRLKDTRVVPFRLDLCRPLAAHCIGFPAVTLGYGLIDYLRQYWKEKEDTSAGQPKTSLLIGLADSMAVKDTIFSLGLFKAFQEEPSTYFAPTAAPAGNAVSVADPRQSCSNEESPSTDSLMLEVAPTVGLGSIGQDQIPGKSAGPTSSVVSSRAMARKLQRASAKLLRRQIKQACAEPSAFGDRSNHLESSVDSNADHESLADTASVSSSTAEESATMKHKNAEILLLQQRIREEQQHRRHLEQLTHQLDLDTKRLKQEAQRQQLVESEIRSQLAEAVQATSSLRAELCQLRSDNESLSNRLGSMSRSLTLHKSTEDSLRDQLTSGKSARKALESSFRDLTSKHEELSKDFLRASEESRMLAAQHRAAQQEISRLKVIVLRVESEAAESTHRQLCTGEYNRLVLANQHLTGQVVKLQERVHQLERRVHVMQKYQSQLSFSLLEANQTHDHLLYAYTAKCRELDAVTSQASQKQQCELLLQSILRSGDQSGPIIGPLPEEDEPFIGP